MNIKLTMTSMKKGDVMPTITDIEGSISPSNEDLSRLVYILLAAAAVTKDRSTPREVASNATTYLNDVLTKMPGRKERIGS